MKKMKKLSCLILALLILLAMPIQALADTYNIEYGDITVSNDGTNQKVDYYNENKEAQQNPNDPEPVVTGTGSNTVTLDSSNGATASVTIQDATINKGIVVSSGSSAEITVQGENQVKGDVYKAGVEVSEGTKLTITGDSTGKLEANGYLAAGIGGSDGQSAGTVIIEGGTVIANGSADSAGIGGGSGGSGDTVIITGGTVEATGGSGAAGIGGGSGGNGGTVKIEGGTVEATSGSEAAGIGGGKGGNGNYNISGGVYETDGGKGGNGGTVKIEGGTVTATGHSADIGGGNGGMGKDGGAGGDGANVTITGGTVTAPNIGGGDGGMYSIGGSFGGRGADGSLTISGATVNGVVYPEANPQPEPAPVPEVTPLSYVEEAKPEPVKASNWDALIWKINQAPEGSEFTYDAGYRTWIPRTVIQAAQAKNITLIIQWDGGEDITVKPTDQIDLTMWKIYLADLA